MDKKDLKSMKMIIKETVFDENSSERIPLCIKGISYGTYSFGTYSKWYLRRIESGGRAIPDVDRFVAGLILDNFNINIYSENADQLIVERIKDGDIGAWFESYMEEELAKMQPLKES